MKQDDDLPFTRRRLLTGLGTVGTAGVLGGSGTLALMNREESKRTGTETAETGDSALASEAESTTAPKLDVESTTWYNGEKRGTESFSGDSPSTFSIPPHGDLLPGDYGKSLISVTVDRAPASVWLRNSFRRYAENGIVEPEQGVDSTGGNPGYGQGELVDEIDVTVWYGRGGDGDRTELASGLLSQVLAGLKYGIRLDAKSATSGTNCFEPGTTFTVGFEWELPAAIDNAVQSDSVSFDLGFRSERCRNDSASEIHYRGDDE